MRLVSPGCYDALKGEIAACVVLFRHTHVSLGMRQLYSPPLVSSICDWSVSRYYLGQRSNILLVDLEIMKQIAVKEFNSFVEREVTHLASFPGLPRFLFSGLCSVKRKYIIVY